LKTVQFSESGMPDILLKELRIIELISHNSENYNYL